MTVAILDHAMPLNAMRHRATQQLAGLIALLALIVFAIAPHNAAADTLSEAQVFVDELSEEAITILSDASLSEESAVDAFRPLLRESFDIRTIGAFALGTYWRQATPEQREEYLGLFEEMVLQTYARRFSEYDGQDVIVSGARPEGERDVLVLSRVVDPGTGDSVDVGWRVRPSDGELRIIDVLVAGVSMTVTQRDEFRSVIARNGGQLEGLLNELRTRVEG